MINPAAFKTCIAGLIGFQPSLDQQMPSIEDSLQESESGIFVNDIHSLVTVENIYNSIINTGLIVLPTAWNSATAYTIGQRVTSAGIVYTALQAGTNHSVTDTLYWTRNGNPLSMYLADKINQSAVKLANAVFQDKNLNQQAKSILPEVMLYGGNGNLRNIVTPSNRFVGFRLKLKESDLGSVIRKIGLQFNGILTDFNIYLYNGSNLQPVKIWDIATTESFTFQWKELSREVLSFLTDTTNVGSDYYIGYYESDLDGVMAVNNEYTFTRNLCGSCNPANAQLRASWGAYYDVTPFYVLESQLPGDRTMWNTQYTQFTDGVNFGLNLLVNVFCDSTDFFCRNRHGLANAMALQTAVSIIEDMGFSMRDNQQQLKSQQLANYALNNRDNNTPGLYAELKKAIQAVDFNFSGTNSKCLPCEDIYHNKLTMGSVY